MTDKELAIEIIDRLNNLIKNDDVRKLFEHAIETRTIVSDSLLSHSTIQAWKVNGDYCVGFLGLLNGIVGAISGGSFDK